MVQHSTVKKSHATQAVGSKNSHTHEDLPNSKTIHSTIKMVDLVLSGQNMPQTPEHPKDPHPKQNKASVRGPKPLLERVRPFRLGGSGLGSLGSNKEALQDDGGPGGPNPRAIRIESYPQALQVCYSFSRVFLGDQTLH